MHFDFGILAKRALAPQPIQSFEVLSKIVRVGLCGVKVLLNVFPQRRPYISLFLSGAISYREEEETHSTVISR